MLSTHQNTIKNSGFENLTLRASGQVAVAVKSHAEILALTLDAWRSMEKKVFISAWITCGYINIDEMNLHARGDAQVVVEEAQNTLSDMFTPFGKQWSPQRCTAYEWQVQDWPICF